MGRSARMNAGPLFPATRPPIVGDSQRASSETVADERPKLRIHLLGQMRVTNERDENVLPKSRHARAIIAALCLARGEKVPRTRLYGQLWDRVDEEQARASFRQALYKLTLALGTDAETLIATDRESLRLDQTRCWIDAAVLLRDVGAIGEFPDGALPQDSGSRLLEDLDGVSASFDQWLMGERVRFTDDLRNLHETALRQLIDKHAPAADIALAARRVIAIDPANEMVSRALMRVLADQGKRAQALREYERCRNALRQAFDVAPTGETTALYQAIKAASLSGTPAAASAEISGGSAFSAAAQARRRVDVRAFSILDKELESSLAGSLARQIAAALARFGWFDVFAKEEKVASGAEGYTSSSRVHDADYAVVGTLSTAGRMLHIDVQLIDFAAESRPIWVEKFKVALNSLGDLYERIVAQIGARIDTSLLLAEGKRATARDGKDAMSLWLRAIPLIYSMERKKYEAAGRLLEQAREAEPENPAILAWSAFWHVFYVGQGWTKAVVAAFELAESLCIQAIRLDPDNAEALGIYAHMTSFLRKDFDNGAHYFERSLHLNPSLAFVWALSAATYCYTGNPEEAQLRLARYSELSPFDISFSVLESIFALAHVLKGEFAQAAVVGRRVVAANPTFVNGYVHLIVALGHLGRQDEAAPYVRKLKAIKPDFSAAGFIEVYPFRRAEDRLRYVEGLHKAGLASA